MDLSKSFNTLNHDLLIAKLPAYGFYTNALKLLRSSLTNRWHLVVGHAFFVYYENADLVYDVIRMRQLSKQTLHELSPSDNS